AADRGRERGPLADRPAPGGRTRGDLPRPAPQRVGANDPSGGAGSADRSAGAAGHVTGRAAADRRPRSRSAGDRPRSAAAREEAAGRLAGRVRREITTKHTKYTK